MGFFGKLKERFFGGRHAVPTPATPSGSGGGWFQRRREARAERKRQREYEKSQRRQEKMDREREEYERKKSETDKKRREAEEKAQKEADRRKREAEDQKMREKFEERWGISGGEYDNFIQFISSFDEYMKEWVQSESLVEIFKTGRQYNLAPEDIKNVFDTTYNEMSGGFTAEDLIDEVYSNLRDYAQNVSKGAYI